jgi:rare lipoprotein A (peptidoglycan hydrolase)
MNASRLASSALVAALVAGLSGCFSAPRAGAPPSAVQVPRRAAPPPPPAHLQDVPDAIPRFEPRSIYGNPPFYDVFGKRYYVMASSVGYVERGVASWYGPGFHKERTSVGEPYDMYGMTAAHKSLPLPAYVRVTNLQNGRSCVVRVNDRGPFVGNRIIDLSYTAAAKLDMLRDGTAMVEVRALQPLDPASDTHLVVASVGRHARCRVPSHAHRRARRRAHSRAAHQRAHRYAHGRAARHSSGSRDLRPGAHAVRAGGRVRRACQRAAAR